MNDLQFAKFPSPYCTSRSDG